MTKPRPRPEACNNLKGRPPEGHARQCQRIKRDGLRCAKWAITNSVWCEFHGGSGTRRKNRKNKAAQVRIATLPMFYSKHLSKTLQEAVEEQLGLKSNEQLNLQTELALMRELCGNAVGLYCVAKEHGKSEDLAEATVLMQEALKEVASLCKDAAAVEASRRDTITPSDLKTITNQMVKILYDVCGDDNEALARLFELRVRKDIKLPSDNQGTSLTPTEDVRAMLDTIPKE